MTRRLALCFVACVFLVATLPAEDKKSAPPTWKAGSGKVVITPKQPMWMSGYAGRDKPAEGKMHDLWAKALVLEDGAGRRVVLVSLDLVGISRELSQAICADLKSKYGLERANVCLSVSHTHTGPVVQGNLDAMYQLDPDQSKRVAEYARELHGWVVEVVGNGIKDLAPARVEWANGKATFAVNRRNNKEADVVTLRDNGILKGPVDHEVPVLAVRDPDGKLRAVAFGYACHSTVLSYFKWTGDYPGCAMLALEKAHPGMTALFWAGCGGDQNPLPRRTEALAEHYGQLLADSVEAVLAAPMKPVTGKLATSYTETDVALGDLPSREQLIKDTMDKNRYIVVRAKQLLKQLEEKGSLKGSYPYPTQVWRLGPDLTWITLGGEVVVDYSLRLKKELGPGQTWVMAYANDVMAYIPSLRVLKEGGYEGASSMIYYGLPTVWGPAVEETIVKAVHAEVKKTQGKP